MWKASGLLEDNAGGKVTLGTVQDAGYEGLWNISGDILGLLIGAAFVAIAFALPSHPRGTSASGVPAQ